MRRIRENDCRDSKKVISFARSNDIEVREGKGSHFVMRKGGDVEVAYHGEISDGVARKVYRFFFRCGLACLIIYTVIQNLT